ncbi:DeoR family fructose operon transcriptional repressor [Kineosphaera limosa]|nr:DeoR/GlpR family DNA-binding transcription regulator [Kineosphaera limosa]NYE00124.1 DeoR family fructose operon transcriptional repressor [Kineosphaera limosa]
MYAEERQEALVAEARRAGRISVAQAADVHGVTPETIRRDLAALDSRGLLRRVHGGAVPTESLRLVELGVAERSGSRAGEKARIARAALAHVPSGPGSTMLLDAGTTTAGLAAILPADPELTIITGSMPIATVASQRCPGPVQFVGGRVRGLTQTTVGAEAVAVVDALRVDVAFVGTNGLTAGHGCSTPDAEEAAVKRAIVSSSRRVVVLADSSKVGVEYLRSFAPLADIDVLITDADVDPAFRSACVTSGIEVVLA